ncbi:hypothetical protein ASD65_00030 [Microbacterium sp. Root61]|uniref:septum formation family protein n=1 Tax=Microbacterium sp. Root61 TaxID=1736570 RepID=UPI0006F73796|nr:septum formation family protein [Microbacterium sp. Root61]KRA22988.1 hypothetical protein ASD65_00030 [Microbacterium sp. Root61]
MKNTRARLAAAAIVLTAMVTLSGCSMLDQFLPSSQPVRDAETGEVTEEAGNADVFAVQVGDCLNTAGIDTEEVSSLPIVPCTEPHDDEVYFSYQVADGAFPGEEALIADAQEACAVEFTTFVGLAYEESALDLWPMYPTEGSWDSGDREVLCIAWDPSGAKLTGTLAGAAR